MYYYSISILEKQKIQLFIGKLFSIIVILWKYQKHIWTQIAFMNSFNAYAGGSASLSM